MVALDKDIHGLAHISELADEGITNISEKFKIGQTTDFEVVSLEPPEHRLGLRLFGVKGKTKKAEEKPAEEAKKPAASVETPEVKEDEKKEPEEVKITE